MTGVQSIFTALGGVFLVGDEEFHARLAKIKAYIFDWDGVFNDGTKNEQGSSAFSEVDAMGTNLLRFSHYLHHGTMPLVAIMSGEKNVLSFQYGEREHFHGIYFRVKHKRLALDHFLQEHNLNKESVAFVFDDALDLALAAECGLRVCVARNSNPLFLQYVKDHHLADYLTANPGGQHAVREACELLMGTRGNYEATLHARAHFTAAYSEYLDRRQQIPVSYYTWDGDRILTANS